MQAKTSCWGHLHLSIVKQPWLTTDLSSKLPALNFMNAKYWLFFFFLNLMFLFDGPSGCHVKMVDYHLSTYLSIYIYPPAYLFMNQPINTIYTLSYLYSILILPILYHISIYLSIFYPYIYLYFYLYISTHLWASIFMNISINL